MVNLTLDKAVGIAEARINRRITLTELAEASGINVNTLYKMRKQSYQGIRYETFARLCICLGVGPGDLLEFVSNPIDGVKQIC